MKKITFVSIVVVLVAFNIKAETRNCEPIKQETLTWEAVADRLNDSQRPIRSVEDLICILPENIRSSYILASNSRSLQQSSAENPRAILFNRKDPTKIILSFNGDPKHRGYNNVEVIRAKDIKTGSIELIDIAFDGSSAPKVTHDPQKCMACHGTRVSADDRRLLFDANPFWEGFYGSSLVQFSSNDPKIKLEIENFHNFQKQALQHPRYRQLINLDSKTVGIQVGAMYVPEGTPENASMRENRLQMEPSLEQTNRVFTEALASFNHHRIANLILNSEFYKSYRYAILGSLACTAYDIQEFIPKTLQSWHQNDNWLIDELKGLTPEKMNQTWTQNIRDREIRELVTDSTPSDEKFYVESGNIVRSNPERIQYYKWLIDSSIRQQGYGANSSVNAAFRYIFESRSKPVPVAEWNIDIDSGSYRFNNNSQMDFDIIDLPPILAKLDPDLPLLPIIALDGSNIVRNSKCDELKQKSLDSLNRFSQNIKPHFDQTKFKLNLTEGSNIVSYSCAHCHNGNPDSFAPPFDFHSSMFVTSLQNLICENTQRPLRDDHHMPKFFRLERSQLDSLYSYFKTLSPDFNCVNK